MWIKASGAEVYGVDEQEDGPTEAELFNDLTITNSF